MTTSPIDDLLAGIDQLGLDVPPGAPTLLIRHLEVVRDANKVTNLTRITNPAAMVRDHILDALALLAALEGADLPLERSLFALDLGSGAGFPGICIAIARPDLQVTLVESRNIKSRFLGHVVTVLELPNVTVIGERGRQVTHHHPELAGAFGLVTARAVAPIAEILREIKQLVASGGLVVHFKGPGMTEDERLAGEVAATKYGFVQIADIATPQADRDLHFVIHRHK
jgi:16S rRNA (guanine527-N7)-methyltransferase